MFPCSSTANHNHRGIRNLRNNSHRHLRFERFESRRLFDATPLTAYDAADDIQIQIEAGTHDSQNIKGDHCQPKLQPKGNGPESTANLKVINTQILWDGNETYVDTIPIGQMISLRLEFEYTNLPNATAVDIVFAKDGLTQTVRITGLRGSGTSSAQSTGWYSGTMQHSLFARLDPQNTISELDETDNVASQFFTPRTPDDLPATMIYPVERQSDVSLFTLNYADVDPRDGFSSDFRGGEYQIDGHQGWDIAPANFSFQDRGIPIVAAASGTVVSTADGAYDRQFNTNTFPAPPENFIVIDHGNGWQTFYGNVARDSVMVDVGQQVSAGQLIANMGSSGISAGTHLSFVLLRHGMPIEPMFQPELYFSEPDGLVYQADQDTRLLQAVIGNQSGATNADWRDGVHEKLIFSTARIQSVSISTWFSHFNPGDNLRIEIYRPDGSVYLDSTETISQIERQPTRFWMLRHSDYRQHVGDWQVVISHNEQFQYQNSFTVASAGLQPLLQVLNATTSSWVPTGQTTPLSTSSAFINSISFRIANQGDATLTLESPRLPEGFSIQNMPSTLAPGATRTVNLVIDSRFESKAFGVIEIPSNDPINPVYSFNVEAVDSSPQPLAVVALPSADVPYRLGDQARLLDPQAEFSTLVSPPGQLRILWEGGRQIGDQFLVLSNGEGHEHIQLDGTLVKYQGESLGTITSNGVSPTPLIIDFVPNAPTPAVTALLQSLAFATSSTNTGPRFIRAYVSDAFGFSSSHAYKSVRVHEAIPPTVVTELTIGDSGVQRSRINSVDVHFGSRVTFEHGAFHLIRREDGEIVDLHVESQLVDGRTVANLTFTGPATQFGSLADGNYQLRILSDKVLAENGGGFDGDGDGISGGDYLFGNEEADNFYRLFGDIDGDRIVDIHDFDALRNAFGSKSQDTAYMPSFDFDANGAIGVFDYAQLRRRFGQQLIF